MVMRRTFGFGGGGSGVLPHAMEKQAARSRKRKGTLATPGPAGAGRGNRLRGQRLVSGHAGREHVPILERDQDPVALLDLGGDELVGEHVLDLGFDLPPQGPRSVNWIVAVERELLLHRV